MNRTICWIRRDIRTQDHAPLAAATHAATSVAVAFVFDRNILSALEDRDDRRVAFIHRSLLELDSRLRTFGSKLVVAVGDPMVEIPRLAQEFKADAVFAGQDYDPYANRRDQEVSRRLREIGSELKLVQDIVLLEPSALRTQAGAPFTVFTPYMKAWRKTFDPAVAEEHAPFFNRLAPAAKLPIGSEWSLADLGFTDADLGLEAGETGASKALAQFLPKLDDYARSRNFPARESTSGLSAHLRFGTLSIRELVRRVGPMTGEGAEAWRNELIWREFYQMILAEFPFVVGGSFKREFDAIQWPGQDSHYNAWCEGRTGFPIVDAAMRCLNQTGWMHNRLRMIAASFLVKDLLIDWRRGEGYFARRLLDFELASNNGGWQWSASTGCDAQPYFRIFNPRLQSERFDPEGSFIRRWCPELAEFSDKHIHAPQLASVFEQKAARCSISADYPVPIVDHAVQRDLALSLFKSAKESNRGKLPRI